MQLNRNDLQLLVRNEFDEFDERLSDDVAPDSPFSKIVFDLLEWAEQRGQLVELLRAAAKERPNRPELADFVRAVEASQTQ